ncbi:cyclopropane-fatty-acyl-phospholipid synthase [Coraliomargarita sp. SDUM461003]|uniref:Cyclopropane-fatty-acyl-phospholipid synthase n=1 Tax=Thalassobacterium maritimum TaxID=3041265 RepID=A0ABU1APL3_9BACT|nr:cyclopropane-fatty-acyl-phospholipid synthase family protein [Coraliomargarita sp. SDUM461003]MDQ8206115.1 cyclopropane-fatty-acyl-phospholipid synthase [Coraliomargarita sp. SDUM461003]
MDTTKSVKLVQAASTLPRMKLMERALAWMLRDLQFGSLQIQFPSGAECVLGEQGDAQIQLKIHRAAFFSKVFSSGSVGLGESYVDGDWDTPDLSALLLLLAKNQQDLGRVGRGFSLLTQQMNRLYHRARRNTLEKTQTNIQEHYDLSNDFYQSFLDPTMTYSSAYFQDHTESLEQAQLRKIDRMLDLAGVAAGDSILEIGSGWGALALRAAQRGCHVKTITLSEEQFTYSKELFARAGCADRVGIALEDYRRQQGQYDAVLSCEMIEAVGREYLQSYFQVIRRSLKPGARAVLQAITISDDRYDSYSRSCDWIQKHIFPGGHLPSPGAIRAHVADTKDMQVLGLHLFGRDYAETLRRWAQSFNAAEGDVDALGFDARFRRKWNYYFSYCEAGFDAELIDVQHVVLERSGC